MHSDSFRSGVSFRQGVFEGVPVAETCRILRLSRASYYRRRRGAAIDLVLDRGRENRSQFVITRIRGGREAIFWQSPRTTKKARPNVPLPTGRAQGLTGLVVIVDSHERYPYTFSRQSGRGHVETVRRALPAGDYAVELDGRVAVAVERKSLADLTGSLLDGTLRLAMTELATLPRAAVVVEDRYSQVFKLEYVRSSVVAAALAEAQVRGPNVPIVFAETRPLAEEWTYRFLAAAHTWASAETAAVSRLAVTDEPPPNTPDAAAPVQPTTPFPFPETDQQQFPTHTPAAAQSVTAPD
ncbi:hypothetical protein HGA89_05415 [bacterium]|nr:hypothetical protein [bacterium]